MTDCYVPRLSPAADGTKAARPQGCAGHRPPQLRVCREPFFSRTPHPFFVHGANPPHHQPPCHRIVLITRPLHKDSLESSSENTLQTASFHSFREKCARAASGLGHRPVLHFSSTFTPSNPCISTQPRLLNTCGDSDLIFDTLTSR